ncbi:hypothetical protein BOTBODRAFT_25832 [Botryobasidium botryosum FD-172 SS1]|uniref:ABC transporter domain-containing protein n=1 Tax=Botryobasidium botryosum (strain FD-172 SS1) TaxID=930990 RepID=A0A067N084_BOTB1|nr:hypothetical protein BOTBODRAFT_25832 [Botryobasidium botryosum FD-172 SS1]
MSNRDLVAALSVVHVASPFILAATTFSLMPAHPAPAMPGSPTPITSVVTQVLTPRRPLILTLLSLAAGTYFLDGAFVILRAVLTGHWDPRGVLLVHPMAAPLLGLVAFGGLAILGTWKDIKGYDVWSTRRVKVFVIVAVLLEVLQVVLLGLSGVLNAPTGEPPHIPEKPTYPAWLTSPFISLALSLLRLIVLLPLYPTLTHPYKSYVPTHVANDNDLPDSPESTSLLASPIDGPGPSSNGLSPYGTFNRNDTLHVKNQPSIPSMTSRAQTPAPPDTGAAPLKPNARSKDVEPSLHDMGPRLRRLIPYLWPSGVPKLQALAGICIFILVIGRLVNVALPFTMKGLVAMFSNYQEGPHPSPWPLLFLFAGLKFLQGSGGLNAIRDTLWAPVMQFSDRRMSQLSFDHLLNLSFSFHMHRKTGEILRVLDRGAAINHIFEMILFQIVPTLLDIGIALGVLLYSFDWTLSVVVLVVMVAYITASIVITSWRTRLRRQMNERDVVTRGIHADCLLNYETIKYFGGEQHEGERYREALRQYQILEYKVMVSLNLLNLVQNFIISVGLLVGCVLVVAQVVKGQAGADDFVFFTTYLAQLYGPLNSLGYIYRTINTNLVDTERLMKLLDEPTEVNDKPGAPDLVVTEGEIEFDNVYFSYDHRITALNGISFKVPKGSSVALVGESGSGKSTILRLLYRFYDLGEGEGRILIDGQDIRDVTQQSLRKAIGVVPQDSILFNNEIGYNIGYGKLGAEQHEIENAARAAQMHDRILGFPDGYATKVGERGVRLSGGEKQRVSIARTFLKNAPILLLDEATSALDTSTEKDIQKALQNLAKGRSSLSIAHRLSTIAAADLILVLKDGQIVEQGSHRELLAQGGMFASMWAEQITADEDGETAMLDDRSASSSKGAMNGYIVDMPTTVAPLETEMHEKGLPTAPEPEFEILPRTVALGESPPPVAGDLVEPIPPKEEESSPTPAPAPQVEPSVNEEPVASEPTPAPTPAPAPAPALSAPSVPPSKEVAPTETPAAAPAETPKPAEAAPATPTKASAQSKTSPARPTVQLAFPSSPPVAFPSSSTATSPAVAFPSDNASVHSSTHRRGQSTETAPGQVTFDESTSARAETPDPTSETKRKRISSQNFQRLARRISISRKGSSGSAGPPREGSFASVVANAMRVAGGGGSKDEGSSAAREGEGSATASLSSGTERRKTKKRKEPKESPKDEQAKAKK